MTATAPITAIGPLTDLRMDSFTSGLSSPPTVPATETPPSHLRSPRKPHGHDAYERDHDTNLSGYGVVKQPKHPKHSREHRQHQHRDGGLSQSSVSQPSPVSATPSVSSSSGASSCTSRSPNTLRYPTTTGAVTAASHVNTSMEHTSSANGHFPLLQAPSLSSVKSYGTASDASSEDTHLQSGHSAVVIARSSATTNTTTTTTANTTARGSMNNSPCPSEESPLGGSHLRCEHAAPTTAAGTAAAASTASAPHHHRGGVESDAAIRVNDLTLVPGAAQTSEGHPPTLAEKRVLYTERAAEVGQPAATADFTLRPHSTKVVSAQAPGGPDAALSYDPHRGEHDAVTGTRGAGYNSVSIHHYNTTGGSVAQQGEFVDGGDGPAASSGKPGAGANLGGRHGYTHLSTADTNDDGLDGANVNNGNNNDDAAAANPVYAPTFFSPNSNGPAPSFGELVVRRLRTTSLLQFLWVLLLIVMLMVGNACQVIFLNFWIHQFPTKSTTPTCPASSSSASGGIGGSSGSSGGGSSDPDRAEALESSYTTFIISAALFSGFFLVLFALYWFFRRPNLKFMREGAGWWLLLGIGAMDTLNSAMAIYAAAHTPEVLQALFVSLVPIYSAFFTKWLLKDPRSYTNVYVTVSFALIMAGVALASLYSYAATHHDHTLDDSSTSSASAAAQRSGHRQGFAASHTPKFLFDFFSPDTTTSAANRDKQIWCLIFFCSVPPTVLLNVWQTMYMIRYTKSDDMTAFLMEHEGESEDSTVRTSITSRGEVRREILPDIIAPEEIDAPRSAHQSSSHTHHPPEPEQSRGVSDTHSPGNSSRSSGESDVVETSVEHQHRLHVRASELLLHGEDTTVKLVMLAADTTIQALMAFVLMPMDALPWFGGSDSIQEVWQNLDEGVDCVLHCPRNLRYCFLYSMGFVLVYIAAAYLNRYSVTLCSMVSQLSGPITALVLIAFPKLNITGDAAPWYVSVFAIVLLSFGTVIYVYWDEMTGEEKARGEMQLKWAMMEEQARRHQRHVEDGGESSFPHDDGAVTYGYTQDPNEPNTSASHQHHRRSRTRRYRRRRQSSYVVVVDHDPDAQRPAAPAGAPVTPPQ